VFSSIALLLAALLRDLSIVFALGLTAINSTGAKLKTLDMVPICQYEVKGGGEEDWHSQLIFAPNV